MSESGLLHLVLFGELRTQPMDHRILVVSPSGISEQRSAHPVLGGPLSLLGYR